MVADPMATLRRRTALLCTLLWLLLPGVPASAAAASLAASAGTVSAGDPVRMTGSVDAPDGCRTGRTVRLEHRAPGEASWSTLSTGETTSGGAFAFEVTPEHTREYQAVVPLVVSPACEAAISPTVTVQVRAAPRVLAPETLRAGRCPAIPVEVRPAKAGDQVRLERRVGDAWREAGTGTLAEDSRAAIALCLRWTDLGTLRLRAVWEAQDASNLEGISAVVETAVIKAKWMRRLDRLAGSLVGISVREDGEALYRRNDGTRRIPASNQKLLLSMAVLDHLGSAVRLRTVAAAASADGGVVPGDLWLIGSGDPTLGRKHVRSLAREIAEAGVTRIEGRVRGSTCCFARDWFAPGWKRDFPKEEVGLPTALGFRGNHFDGRNVRDPERRAAAFLTKSLRARGIAVGGAAGAGTHPGGLTEIASIRSPSMATIVGVVDSHSWNFGAEVLGKLLGQQVEGAPGSIAKGARAAAEWASARGVRWTSRDASGLSYANRVSPFGVARLLDAAEDKPWGPALRSAQASPGHGTLRRRLAGVKVRAKTGTLEGVSALSGWVWLERSDTWAEFSILSRGLSKSAAMRIEDAVVRTLARSAR